MVGSVPVDDCPCCSSCAGPDILAKASGCITAFWDQARTQLGTPAYMSPEQAAGRIRELGPRSDVYSLGATLYCLLTGRAPFEKQEMHELLRKVEHGEFPPPRQVQGGIDPALEAICLKAMKTRPEDRYESPRALADDVEHWLADEPVSAHTEPAMAKIRRWMRKHPSRVTAAAVLLMATVVALTIGTLLLNRSYGLLEQSNILLKEQRQIAKENFQKAREAVNRYYTQVSEEDLLKEERLDPLRKKLLTSALTYYEDFIKQRADDLTVRRELADAYLRASQINWEIGMNDEGQAHAVGAVELYESMLAKSVRDRELREALSASYGSLSILQYHAGQTKAAFASNNRKIELLEQQWKETPGDFLLGRSLAASYGWRAMNKRDAGDEEGAAADFERAVELHEKLLSTAPPEEKEPTLRTLALTYYRSGTLLNCLRALRIFERLERESRTWTPKEASKDPGAPHRPEGRRDRQGPLKNAGYDLNFIGQPRKAEELLREAVDIHQTWHLQNPKIDIPLLYLDWPLGELGESLFLQGKTRAAQEHLRRTREIKKELEDRKVTLGGVWLINHSRFSYLLGCLEGESGEPIAGINDCEQALEEQQQVRDAPDGMGRDNPEVLSDILWTRETIARLQFQAGQINREELLTQQRQILLERRAITQRKQKGYTYPGQYQTEFGASAAVLAGYLLEAGRPAEALAVVNEVLPAQQALVENDNPDNSEVSDYDLRVYVFRQTWAELLARKAQALYILGEPTEAAQAIRQAIEIIEPFTEPEPCYLYDLAHHLALASTLPDSAGVPDAADRAVKALERFIASGFDNPYKLQHDERLDPLRGRADFEALVHDLEAKVGQEAEK